MSCATAKKTVQATSTVEEMPLEPAPAGAPVAAPVVAVESQKLPASEFKLFAAPAEGFSVMGPSNATLEYPKDESGKTITTALLLNGGIGNTSYTLIRQKKSPEMQRMAGAFEKITEQSRKMLSETVGGSVTGKTSFKYKGFNAEEFVINGSKKNVSGRVVYTDNASFNLYVFYDGPPPPTVKAYFDSLEFIPVTPAATPPAPSTAPNWGGPPGGGMRR